jgi:phosphoglycerate dehydrogenase-like enzyme
VKAVLPAFARALLEDELPDDLAVTWFKTPEEATAAIPDAQIAWVDQQSGPVAGAIAAKGERLEWLFTLYAGLDPFPLDLLGARGVTLTNGTGINAPAVADYAMLGVLAAAKRFDEVVRLADAGQWTTNPPGTIELDGSRALIVGYGTIGRMIGDRLAACGVTVTGVTRSGRDGTLTPDQWRARLGDFDWVILAAPSTGETRAMIGTNELVAMRRSAWLVNVARGDMIDQAALVAALEAHGIAGAFLDPTEPEPLPPDHPLWRTPNTLLSMHLAGRSQAGMYRRAARLFLDNLAAFRAGRPMRNIVDLGAGY